MQRGQNDGEEGKIDLTLALGLIKVVIYRPTEARLSIEFVPIRWLQNTDTFLDRLFEFS